MVTAKKIPLGGEDFVESLRSLFFVRLLGEGEL
jgi:hypothetical protein